MKSPELLDDIIRNAAEKYPSKMALRGPDGSYTYSQIDTLAEQFAVVLQEQGVRKGDRVAVYLDKNADSVIIFQGILRAGAIYVPIDLQVPIHGVLEIIAGCSPEVLFTTERLAAEIQAESSDSITCLTTSPSASGESSWEEVLSTASGKTRTPVNVVPTDPAYILYTSGSTGKPKGVCLNHTNALSFVTWAAEETVVGEESIVANHAPFSFGISVYDLYVPFLKGAVLTIVPSRIFLSGRAMAEFMATEKVSHWYSVPSAILLMMRGGEFSDDVRGNLKELMFAGEPFPAEKVNELYDQLPNTRLWNFYGATETNVCCFYELQSRIDAETSSIPIGVAASGDTVWIEPDGEDPNMGELLVQGPTVMLGYWGDEFSTDRIYRTNDIVRRDDNGLLHFLGRNDAIVKVRGYRVSLTEVEEVVNKHPSIHKVAVVQIGDSSTGKLYAFAILSESQREPTLIEIKELCAEHLPSYKIVHRITFVDSLPLNVNGKIDRAALASLV